MSSREVLDQRLRQLVAEMGEVAPPTPVVGLSTGVRSVRRGRRARVVAVGVAAMLVGAVVVAALANIGDDGTVDVATVTAGDAVRDPAPATTPIEDGAVVVLDATGEAVDLELLGWVWAHVRSEVAALDVLGASPAERLSRLDAGELTVTLALDPSIQALAEQALTAEGLDAVLVTVDNSNGAVVASASVGAVDLDTPVRAPTVRMAVYAAALEAGYTLDDEVDGTTPCPVTYGAGPYEVENLGNFDGTRQAFVSQILVSSRCAQLRLEADLGPDAVATAVSGLLGVEVTDPVVVAEPLVSALGQATMTATIANSGRASTAGVIAEISAGGEVLYRRAEGDQVVLSDGTATAMMEAMALNVVQGTGTRASIVGANAAGLTGDLVDFSMAAFAGTVDGYSTVIWVARPDGASMRIPPQGGGTGGAVPATTWSTYHQAIHDGTELSSEPPATDLVASTDDGRPARWLGVQTTGRLVLVDTEDQTVIETYGGLGDPTATPPPEGGPNVIDSAWQVPGTDHIYIAECCEPAGGNGIYIDSETTLDDRVSAFSGFAAVPSPDGILIAVPQNVGLFVSGSELFAPGHHVSTTRDFGAASVAWLRDRRGVVWTPLNDDLSETIELIELDNNNQPVIVRELPNPGLFELTVAVRVDGAVVVAGCEQSQIPCASSRAVVIDPDSGDMITEFAIEAGARLGGYDRTGRYLVYTDAATTARWQGVGQSGILGSGYSWATW